MYALPSSSHWRTKKKISFLGRYSDFRTYQSIPSWLIFQCSSRVDGHQRWLSRFQSVAERLETEQQTIDQSLDFSRREKGSQCITNCSCNRRTHRRGQSIFIALTREQNGHTVFLGRGRTCSSRVVCARLHCQEPTFIDLRATVWEPLTSAVRQCFQQSENEKIGIYDCSFVRSRLTNAHEQRCLNSVKRGHRFSRICACTTSIRGRMISIAHGQSRLEYPILHRSRRTFTWIWVLFNA